MPRFSPDPVASGPAILGFVGAGFRIDQAVFREGALLSPDAVMAWSPPPIAALDIAALGSLLDREPVAEFLLLGTGAAIHQPPAAFVAALDARGIGLELMDSRTAAHGWGVLRAESRQIVAALYPLDR